MGAIQRIRFLSFMVAALLYVASADSGQATFYTPPYIPSSCYGYQDQGVMIAAAPANIYNNKAACGNNYQISCTSGTNAGVAQPCRGGSVTVKVVDLCPGCANNQFDLSQEAFNIIYGRPSPIEGKININFNQV